MKIFKGNYFDSRIGTHSYSMWTTGYDVCIEDEEKKYFYQLRNFDCDCVTTIAPVEIKNATEVAWDELNVNIRKAHFHAIKPNGTESEMNLFIYGKEEGAKINAENEWAEAHIVYSRGITLSLVRELGHFKEVKFLRSMSRWVGTGYVDYIYVIDNKWQVTVSANSIYYDGSFHNTYTVQDYSKVVAQEKAFGRRVARLAKRAGVPWNVGVFVGHIVDDDEAISILKQIKSVRGTADLDLQHELLRCGIGRRTAAIEYLLGDTWKKLNCKGQNQTTILADYLSGE